MESVNAVAPPNPMPSGKLFHDLRNALNGAALHLQIALDEAEDDAAVRAALEALDQAVARVGEIEERQAPRDAPADDASPDRYSALVSGTRAVVWTTSPEGTFTKRQPSWEAYTGQAPEEYEGTGWLEMIHPDDREALMERWTEALRDGAAPYRFAGRLWHDASDSYRHMEAEAVPVVVDGRVVEWIGTVNDMHDKFVGPNHRATVVRDLSAENTRLESILEGIAKGFVSLDADGRVRYANRRAASWLGATPDAILGEPFVDAVPEEHRETIGERCMAALVDDRTDAFEVAVDDSRRVVNVRCAPAMGGLSLYLSDVTDQKVVERRLRVSEADARRFSAVVEESNDFIGIMDTSGALVYVNRAGRRLVGLPPSGDLGGAQILDLVARDDVEVVERVALPCLRRGERVSQPVHLLHQESDLAIPTLFNAFVIEGDEHSPDLWVTISPDLTRHEQLERRLRESEQRAQQASVAKSAFLANMSHEIRTPMTALLGHTDLLLGRDLDDDTRASIVTIQRNGQYLLDLINDVLDLARIEAGRFDIDARPTRLATLLIDVCSLMRVQAERRGLTLDLRLEGRVPERVVTDARRLRQVLLNVIGNAVKFTEKGRVDVVVRTVEPWVEIEVRDTGIGIADEQLERLFTPFTQADASISRRFGGSGLGLAISARLVELLDGEIGAESALGEGTRFFVRVPLGGTTGVTWLDESDGAEASPSGDVAERVRLECRVLVVDDQPDIRDLCARLLERAGMTTEQADGGRSALRRALDGGAEALDVILLDMQMPDVDGYETARRLRAAGVATPIVAVTAQAMRGDRERCLAAGCDAYVPKPIDVDELLGVLADLVPSAFGPGADAVLVVDDHVDAADVLCRLLRQREIDATAVHTGADAIRAAGERTYSAIIVDIGLPDADGAEVADTLRTSGFEGRLIALTGRQVAELERPEAFDRVLRKPASADELVAAVRAETD